MNTYSFRKLLLLIVVLLASIADLMAQANIDHVKRPSWLRETKLSPSKVDTDDISGGYYYERQEYQVHIGLQERYYQEVRVVTEEQGTSEAGQVMLLFDPSYQRLLLHEIAIVRDGKIIDKTDSKSFKLAATETDISRSIYNGTYTAYCIIDDLRKGDRVRIAYSIKGFNPVFENKFFDQTNLRGSAPIGLLHIHYVVPTDRKLDFAYYGGATPMQTQQTVAGTGYFYEQSNVPKAILVDFAPAWYVTVPSVACSEFRSWKEVGEWVARINPIPKLKAGKPISLFADQLWQKAKGDPTMYLKLATDFVQNEVRYLGIEVGEFSHRASSPEKVFMQRYGDCKDKSVLLAAILMYKGIESGLGLVNTYVDRGLDIQIPSPQSFNHMVVRVVLNDRGQWIDPTLIGQGGDILQRYFPPYGTVLNVSQLRMDEIDTDLEGLCRIAEVYQMQEDGSARLKVTSVYSRSAAEEIRSLFKSNALNQVQEQYLKYYQSKHAGLTLDGNLQYTDDLTDNVFSVQESYRVPKIWELDENNKYYIGFYAQHIDQYLPTVYATRSEPIGLPFPLKIEHELCFVNPNGIPMPSISESFHQQLESYFYSRFVRNQGDSLKISHSFYAYKPYIDGLEIPAYVESFKNRNAAFYASFYLNKDFSLDADSLTQNTIGEISLYPVLLLLIALLIFGVFVWKYTPSEPGKIPDLYTTEHYPKLGGWVIVMGITIVVNLVYNLLGAAQGDMFNAEVWESFEGMDNTSISYSQLQILISLDLLTTYFILLGYTYSVYLFIKRRNIFPQTYFYLLLAATICSILSVLWPIFALPSLEINTAEMTTIIGRGIMHSMIWMAYLYHSERVKGTFVLPYKVNSHDSEKSASSSLD